jgi:hypothetical protein
MTKTNKDGFTFGGVIARETIVTLSRSQGSYGRLLESICEADDPVAVFNEIGEGCRTMFDVVSKVEGF